MLKRLMLLSLIFVVLFVSNMPVLAEVPQAEEFGNTKDNVPVEIFTLENEHKMRVRLMTRGATIVSIDVPDKAGTLADVVLGFDDIAGYEGKGNGFFGCTAGRVANRIAKGKFTLDGRDYSLAVNNGPNHLHGGVERSLDKVVWAATPFENKTGTGVTFRYNSPHGEEGYPGTLSVKLSYTLLNNANTLKLEYSAMSDQATPINLTNHSYFNLAGAGSETVLDHELQLSCDQYTAVDDTLIPTGKIENVAGTDLDFRTAHTIGERIQKLDETATTGYDHNFIINGEMGTLRPVARLKDPKSGRVLAIQSTEPGVQFYSGNFLSGDPGKGGKPYPHRSALCLETQHYPDSINHPEFPNTVLRPGTTYTQTTTFEFSAE